MWRCGGNLSLYQLLTTLRRRGIALSSCGPKCLQLQGSGQAMDLPANVEGAYYRLHRQLLRCLQAPWN